MACHLKLQDQVAVIIVNYRTPQLTLACVAALAGERVDLPDLRAVIIDGGSADGSAEQLRKGLAHSDFADWCTFIPLDLNGGFGWANNQAILHLMQQDRPPDYIHLLNPDTVIEPGAVRVLKDSLNARPKAACTGSQLLEPDGQLTGSAFRFPTVAREFARGLSFTKISKLLGIQPLLIESTVQCRAEWVTGASVMFRRAALEQSGLFDDGFFLYFEEVELMYRLAELGWERWVIPESRVMHMAGASTGVASGSSDQKNAYPAYWFASRRRFFARTYGARSAWWANVAWLIGDGLRQIIALFRPRLRSTLVPGERAGIWSTGLSATPRDRMASSIKITDQPGALPFWRSQTP